MRLDTLNLLRCPFCGGSLAIVESSYHSWTSTGALADGILGCHCCIFPVVDGIPVLHLLPAAVAAREQVQDGRPHLARRTMMGFETAETADRFETAAASDRNASRDLVEALGTSPEWGYFLYRYSDPTFLVADALVRAIAPCALSSGRPALEMCGGSGHLTRSLSAYASTPVVLADLSFAKIWLARRFNAPGCEPVCCDGNGPLPFARGAFALAVCADAFMYIWTKRSFVAELSRAVEHRQRDGTVLICHAHNERVWNPSQGQALTPRAYADLFETVAPRVFGEGRLFDDILSACEVDLSRAHPDAVIDEAAALAIVATERSDVLVRRVVPQTNVALGHFRLNPLYQPSIGPDAVTLRLRFPSADYADEYASCRRYLPDELAITPSVYARLPAKTVSGELVELVRRRVLLDLPDGYL